MAEPQRRRAPLAFGAEVLNAELVRVRAALSRQGWLELGDVRPKALRDELLARLEAEGFELTARGVRRPLAEQLSELLRSRRGVPEAELPGLLHGASRDELDHAVRAALHSGAAQRVTAGRGELLVDGSAGVLTARELERLDELLSPLTLLLASARKKKNAALLASDVQHVLSQAQRVVEERSTAAGAPRGGALASPLPVKEPAAQAPASLALLLDAIDAVRDERTSLSFIPRVVEALRPVMSLDAARAALLAAARSELLELRPEGGLSRLSASELAACPRGPGGTYLSWVRKNAEAAP